MRARTMEAMRQTPAVRPVSGAVPLSPRCPPSPHSPQTPLLGLKARPAQSRPIKLLYMFTAPKQWILLRLFSLLAANQYKCLSMNNVRSRRVFPNRAQSCLIVLFSLSHHAHHPTTPLGVRRSNPPPEF